MTQQPHNVDTLNGFRGPLAEKMGIVITQADIQTVAASMPVAGNTQPFGLLHGGASAVLAETVGSIAAAIHGRAGSCPGRGLPAMHTPQGRSGRVGPCEVGGGEPRPHAHDASDRDPQR